MHNRLQVKDEIINTNMKCMENWKSIAWKSRRLFNGFLIATAAALQVKDQEFNTGNAALLANYHTQTPVRVLRGSREDNKLQYIYDGLYLVIGVSPCVWCCRCCCLCPCSSCPCPSCSLKL